MKMYATGRAVTSEVKVAVHAMGEEFTSNDENRAYGTGEDILAPIRREERERLKEKKFEIDFKEFALARVSANTGVSANQLGNCSSCIDADEFAKMFKGIEFQEQVYTELFMRLRKLKYGKKAKSNNEVSVFLLDHGKPGFRVLVLKPDVQEVRPQVVSVTRLPKGACCLVKNDFQPVPGTQVVV